MNQYPLISCICITKNRPSLLKKAIAYFVYQNYPNKELVISYPKNDKASREVIENAIKKLDINIFNIDRSVDESLGNARNNAIAKCKGDYACMWDDDDWFHSSRLSFQFNSMQIIGQRYQASILSQILLYDSTTEKAYASFLHTWEGTILCRKEILLQNQYTNRNQAEDTHVISFLSSRNILYEIEEAAFLYIYIYHGYNTWNYEHFKYFIDKSVLLDDISVGHIKKLVTQEVDL